MKFSSPANSMGLNPSQCEKLNSRENSTGTNIKIKNPMKFGRIKEYPTIFCLRVSVMPFFLPPFFTSFSSFSFFRTMPYSGPSRNFCLLKLKISPYFGNPPLKKAKLWAAAFATAT